MPPHRRLPKRFLLKNKAVLTSREIEVMQMAKKGLSNKAIADSLHISSETVKKHLQNIFEKLGATNKIEALNKMGQDF